MKDKDLENFCRLLEEQAERQETLVAVCLAQLRAGFEGNMKYFIEKTSAIDFLVKETAQAEYQRRELMDRIGSYLGMRGTDKRVRELAEQIDEPWKSRILDACERIRMAILYLKAWLSEALPFYKVSMESAKNTLKKIYPDYEDAQNVAYSDPVMKKSELAVTRFVDDRG